MMVCHCERVGSAAVEAAIASGAASVDDITARCRAGGGCGSCTSTLESLLALSAARPYATANAA